MFGYDDAISAVGLLPGLISLFGKKSDPRMDYLNQLGQQYATQENDLRGNNQRTLYKATGQGGDAIAALGRRLGSSLAGAGVYNSTATAGALTQAQQQEQAQLAAMAEQQKQQELQANQQNQQYLTGQRLNIAQGDTNYNRQQRAGSVGGLASFIGQIAQRAVQRNGAGNRTAGDAGNGYQNFTTPTAPSILDYPTRPRNPWSAPQTLPA